MSAKVYARKCVAKLCRHPCTDRGPGELRHFGLDELSAMVCCFSRKKSRKVWRTRVLVGMARGRARKRGAEFSRAREKVKRGAFSVAEVGTWEKAVSEPCPPS